MTELDTEGRPIEPVDPRKPTIITVIGRKGSGKSIIAASFWQSWPWDGICIDVTRDALVGPAARNVSEIPDRFPQPEEGETRTLLNFQPDPGDASYLEDLDRAVGLAVHNPRRKTLLWIDERGEFTVHPGPYMKRALNQSRHWGLSLMTCGPRAVSIDPLLIGQADYLYVFDLPTLSDRRRIADTIGVDLAELTRAIFALPKHGYLRWDSANRDMVEFPPLPNDYVAQLRRGTPSAGPAA